MTTWVHITDADDALEGAVRELVGGMEFENPDTNASLAEGIIAAAKADARDPRFSVDYPTALRTAIHRLGGAIDFRSRP